MRFIQSIDLLMYLSLETNDHHKDWLTYSCGTDVLGELCYNFSVSNDLTHMFNFLTWIPDFDSHSLALFDLFISYECSAVAFPQLGNSDHVLVSISIDFSSNSKRYVPFHCTTYNYSCVDQDVLWDHLRDIPW